MSDLLKIEFTVPAEREDECVAFLSANVAHGWEEDRKEDRITYRLYLEDHEAGNELVASIREQWPESSCSQEDRKAENWALAWQDFFVPIQCGDRFEILPPWRVDEHNEALTPIIIEPKMAFGTGHHPTTALCIETLAQLQHDGLLAEGMSFLDLGTGSGILSIALCKLGMTGIGVDIDPLTIPCAIENAEINGVSDRADFAVGGIECIEPGRRFDVVVANILSGPLIAMAGQILSHVRPGGCLVLSGILGEQGASVAAAYMEQGLPRPTIVPQGEWVAIYWTDVPEAGPRA